MNIEKVNEIRVVLENEPGALAKVANALGASNVNILGFTAQAHGGQGPLHLITDDPEQAKQVLTDLGLDPSTQDVVVAGLPNVPGELGDASQRLAESGINIEAAYPTLGDGSRSASIAFATDDVGGAYKALQG